jgi:putative endonuclease
MAFFVYILVSEKDGSLYTGQTVNLKNRLERHNHKLITATKARTPFRLGYFEAHPTRSAALWREWQLKRKWNTERKRKLVQEFDRSKITQILGL